MAIAIRGEADVAGLETFPVALSFSEFGRLHQKSGSYRKSLREGDRWEHNSR